MHTVARPIDVAAGNALVRLHEVKARPAPRCASRAREGPVAPHLADIEGVDLHYAPRAPAFGFSADQGDFRTRSLERRHGACDEALGVPIAAARCIGIESTPMKRCARAVSAPSSLSDSLPARLSGLLAVFARIWSMKPASCGAAVSTTGWPSAARRSASCALRSAGQH